MVSSRDTSHVRSSSWPSKSSQPLDSSIEHLLLRLRNSEARPDSSWASSIGLNLCDVKELYQGINNSIECPLTRHVLSLEQHRDGVEEALEGSVAFLDACGSIMDILSLVKESILELESSLRRKGNVEEKHIGCYMTSRKKIQKMANKCLKNLQNVGSERDSNHLAPVLRMLSEAHTISLSALKSVVAYVSSAKGTGWSTLAKLVHSILVMFERKAEASEVQRIDQALLAYEAKKSTMDPEVVQNLLKQSERLELAVQEIKQCLESVSRCLLRTRVSLLNILSH